MVQGSGEVHSQLDVQLTFHQAQPAALNAAAI